MKYMAAVLLLLAAMSAQNAPSTNKGSHLDIPAISQEANGKVVSIDGRSHALAWKTPQRAASRKAGVIFPP